MELIYPTTEYLETMRVERNKASYAFDGNNGITPEQQKEWFSNFKQCPGQSQLFIATLGNEPIGTIGYQKHPESMSWNHLVFAEEHCETELTKLIIFEEYRGKGYLPQIFHAIMSYVPDTSYFLRVNSDNERGIRAYEKYGFVPYHLEGKDLFMNYTKENYEPIRRRPILRAILSR
jgi:RimJ/RimL family protein N-acetyltransferase